MATSPAEHERNKLQIILAMKKMAEVLHESVKAVMEDDLPKAGAGMQTLYQTSDELGQALTIMWVDQVGEEEAQRQATQWIIDNGPLSN